MGAAPARADNSDLAKILAGAATLVIIGSVIKDQRDKAHAGNNDGNRAHRHDGWRKHRWDRRGRHHTGRKHHARIVPAQCLRKTRARNGPRRYFARPCLKRTMRHVERLPNACAFRVNGGAFGKIGYRARCLRRHGWKRG